MEQDSPPPKTVALILNTALPNQLGKISEELIEIVAEFTGFRHDITIHPIDLATLDLPLYDASYPERLTPEEAAKLTAWRAEASRHSAYIFLFPLYTWSHTNPIKNATHHLPASIYRRKPTLLVTFSREDRRPWNIRQEKPGHIPRESVNMVEEFLAEKGFYVLRPKRESWRWPTFEFFWDIWDSADKEDRAPSWPGGNQDEAWENPTWNRMVEWAQEARKVIENYKRR